MRHVRKLENGAAEAWIAEQYLTNELFEPPPLPEQFETERTILGLALLDREIFASIEEEIVATDFAVDLHAALFDYLAELYRGGGTFDGAAATLAIGGDHEPFAGYSLKAYLARIAAAAPLGVDARALARSIAEEAAIARGEPDAIQDLEEEKKPFVSQFDGLPFERLDEPGQSTNT